MRENDLTLLRRYASDRSQTAFAEIVRRHMDTVYSSALRRVNGDTYLAKDVAQDVFISLAHHAESLAGHQCLTGWLYTTTRNAAANRIRTEIRRRVREEEAAAMEDAQSSTDNTLAWDRVSPFIEQAIDKLGERDRLAILLRFFEHRTFLEIGSSLQISEDGARLRVDRALEKLYTLLSRTGIRSTAAAVGVALAQNAVHASPAELHGTITASVLQKPRSFGIRIQDIAQSLHLTEAAAFTVAMLLIVGSILLGQKESAAARSTEALSAVEMHAIAQARQQLIDLEQRRESKNQVQTNPQPAVARVTRRSPQPRPSSSPVLLAGGRKTELSANYNSFYLAQGLGPAQIEQFEKIRLSEASGSGLWLFEQAIASGSPAPLSAIEVEQQLRQVLGAFGYEKYLDYNRIIPAKTITAQLAGFVYLTDPINREQCEQLTGILAHACDSYQSGGTIDPATLDWDTVIVTAGRLLTPSQLTALKAARQQNIFLNAFYRSMEKRRGSTPSSAP